MKIFRLFLLLPVLFFSCADKYYVTEEYFITEVIREEVAMNTITKEYVVFSRDWKLFDDWPEGNEPEDSNWTYFYYDFRESALTNFIFNQGMMNAFLITSDRPRVYAPLPFDDFYKDTGDGWRWTEHVTCEFSPQNIRFIVRYNDFDVDRLPLSYTFMVRFAW
jgi:hypothetical protein